MPNYDYFCQNCQHGFAKYISYSDYGKTTVPCPKCGSREVERSIMQIRISKSEESRLENFEGASSFNDLAAMEKNPQALGRMMRKMGSELGEEMGSEFNEVVDRLESGQAPEEIEQDLPEIADQDLQK